MVYLCRHVLAGRFSQLLQEPSLCRNCDCLRTTNARQKVEFAESGLGFQRCRYCSARNAGQLVRGHSTPHRTARPQTRECKWGAMCNMRQGAVKCKLSTGLTSAACLARLLLKLLLSPTEIQCEVNDAKSKDFSRKKVLQMPSVGLGNSDNPGS